MKHLEIMIMKVIRRIKNRLENWYRKTSFLSGLEYYENNINVYGG